MADINLINLSVCLFQINTRLENCGKVVSCNCAVAVKAVDDVIVIDRCGRRQRNMAYGASFPDGWRTVHKHVLEQGEALTEGLKIYEHDDGRKYTVGGDIGFGLTEQT